MTARSEAELGALDLASELPAVSQRAELDKQPVNKKDRHQVGPPRLLCGHALRFEAGPGQVVAADVRRGWWRNPRLRHCWQACT